MQIDPQVLVVLALNILAVGITYGDARARINMLEKNHAELRDEVREALRLFGEKQEKVLEKLVSIEATLKVQERTNDTNE